MESQRIDVNQYFEGLLDENGVWYIRQKKLKGTWERARHATAQICRAILAGQILPTDNPEIEV